MNSNSCAFTKHNASNVDQLTAQQQLANTIVAATPAPQHPALLRLVEALRDRHNDCAAAVLFYGSCLRSGDPYDGLVDLYLVVDNYRCANSGILSALWNWLLPPNVFYAEVPHEDRTVRCKYAVLSRADLLRGTSRRWFHSYLWGRFSQPVALAWYRNDAVRAEVATGLASAALTFLNRVLPAIPARGTLDSLWRDGLRLSYRAELRAESTGRASELSHANQPFYVEVTRLALPLLQYEASIEESRPQPGYQSHIAPYKRIAGRVAWSVRIVQGKLLSVARLLKALFTFTGGLDYIAWKLERHSGVKVEIPERVRRYPLIFIWGLFWDLYRRGAFR